MIKTETYQAAARFFALAQTAADNGGFWVSAGGGTARVVAGAIARSTGDSFSAAFAALETMGQETAPYGDWYVWLDSIQPNVENYRFDAETVARAAAMGACK